MCWPTEPGHCSTRQTFSHTPAPVRGRASRRCATCESTTRLRGERHGAHLHQKLEALRGLPHVAMCGAAASGPAVEFVADRRYPGPFRRSERFTERFRPRPSGRPDGLAEHRTCRWSVNGDSWPWAPVYHHAKAEIARCGRDTQREAERNRERKAFPLTAHTLTAYTRRPKDEAIPENRRPAAGARARAIIARDER